MTIEKVRGNTYIIDTGMTYIPFYKINDREIILLDSGWVSEGKGIEDILTEYDLKIAGIINSHAHPDHIGNNSAFKEKYNCVIAMSKDEAFLCSSLINLKTYYNTQTNTLTDVKKHYGYMVCETDVIIADEQTSVYLCGVLFKIFHTPGHSSSQICIITPDNVAYLGDSLITREVMESSKVPYSFVLKEDLVSKKKLHELHCHNYIIAHKGVVSDISELIEENIIFYKNKAEKVYQLIEGDMTMEDIMKSVIINFNIKVDSIYKYDMVFRMLRCYVEYLYEEGKITLATSHGFLKYSKF
ncbi:MAG: hydrolase [Anaerocolumna sp.]|jgi:glyoxylase-like metal-dependent hydrolase (beta-lactamase superfamily II)|nr:hydrolase [Anaerocolumna sp.]